jgi:predicted nucleic acid-binding protein
MNILLDTSVLVAAIVEAHPAHDAALPWLQRVKHGEDRGLIAAHTIAELYAILTTLPIRPKISPEGAKQLIQQDVLSACDIITLSDEDYKAIIDHLSEAGIAGGVIYDALILYTALKTDVEQVITLNEKDFRRIYPELADKIFSPLRQ